MDLDKNGFITVSEFIEITFYDIDAPARLREMGEE